MFGALQSRNFRLFWVGAFVSNLGSWIQTIALNWLVLTLTNSPLALGIVSFSGTVPILALSLIGGVYVDRVERRLALRVTQSLLLVWAMILAFLTWRGLIRIEYIVIISLLTGIVMAANSPAWQAFIVDLVEQSDLPTAIALNSAQFNLSRVLGPSVAGLLLVVIGAAGCFLVNGLSFLAVVGALFLIKPRPAALGFGGAICLLAGITMALTNPGLRLLPSGATLELAPRSAAQTSPVK